MSTNTAKTYTLLVTVLDERPPTAEGLAMQVEKLLEEGALGYVAYSATAVSGIEGDHVRATLDGPYGLLRAAKKLHEELRRGPPPY
jgi:hypothetical protein